MGRAIAVLTMVALATPALSSDWSFSGQMSGEVRGFFHDVQYPAQFQGAQPSLLIRPELRYTSEDERHQIYLSLFTRLDSRDPERSHYDVREAYWRYVGDGWDALVGVNQVFWGVAESRHLVDVVNQADFLEDIDGEDKLGQPMVQFQLQRGWGNIGLFVMPGFRGRSFPSSDGRLRLPLPVAKDRAQFESSAGERHVDYALRYSHYLGDWDVGLSLFHGTSREPRFELDEASATLVPHYDITSQVGLDLQYTKGAWLWKVEGLLRSHREERFAATVAGLEYTFYQAFHESADLGVLVEYLKDGRGDGAPVTAFDDDVFVGARISLNDSRDTYLLAGAVIDRNSGATAVRLESERRLGAGFTLEVEGRFFFRTGGDALSPFARDDFTLVRLGWFF